MCIQAPEMVLERGASFPQDIWSLGCLLFELVTGNPLFPADHAQLRHIFLKQVSVCKASESTRRLSSRLIPRVYPACCTFLLQAAEAAKAIALTKLLRHCASTFF